MRNHITLIAVVTLIAVLSFAATLMAGGTQTFSGIISDDMCGRKHTMMPGRPDSECIRACVKSGSKYSLLVRDKVYRLTGDTKRFDQLAGTKVTVTGSINGTTIAVTNIAEAR